MIGPDDIEAFSEDLAVADRIVSRVERGVPRGREVHAGEVMPLIRAYVVLRAALGAVARNSRE